jgi:hypothetical protein
MNTLEILEFKPFVKNTLMGFLTVRLPSGWEFKDLTIHEKNGNRWIGMPAKSFKKEDGSTGWVPLIKMADKAKWEAFQAAVLAIFAALDAVKPEERKIREEEATIPF